MRSIRIIFLLAAKHLRVLSRTPGIVLVIFLPGIVMYSVFTKIFEGPAGVGRPFRAGVVDLDGSEESRKLIEMLEKSRVTVIRTEDESPEGPPLTVASARKQIRIKGEYRVAVVIPKGFGEAPNTLAGERHEGVELIHDETQPMEAETIIGLLQMAAGRQVFAKTLDLFEGEDADAESGAGTEPRMLINVKKTGVAIHRMKPASKHIFLAGIVPMFLLFAAVGAARSMLEEMHRGETIRLLAAPISAFHLVISGQVSQFVVAMLQCYSMYVFAWLVFGVAIWEITSGLFVLTVFTCLATTGFGMFLGSVMRSSQQIDSIGTIIILAMSAVGGSMVPRFVMPIEMQRLGLFTINGWSYDGFIALIRNEGFGIRALMRNEGVQGIWLSCLVLLLIALACVVVGSLLLTRRLKAGPSS